MKKVLKYFCIFLILAVSTCLYLFLKTDIVKADEEIEINHEKVDDYWIEYDNFIVYRLYIKIPEEVKFNYNHIVGTVELTNAELVEYKILDPNYEISFTSEGTSFTYDVYIKGDISNISDKFYILEYKIHRTAYDTIGFNFQVKYILETMNNFSIKKAALDLDGNEISSVKKNDMFYYEIEVSGIDNFVETNEVTLTDNIPDEFQILSSDATSVDENNLIWNLGSFNKGNETKTLRILVKALEKGTFENKAILDTGIETLEATSNIIVKDSDISISKTANVTSINDGDEFTYTILVKNDGNLISEDVTVTDVLDSNLSIISSSLDYTETNGKLTFNLGKIEAGKTVTIKLNVASSNNITVDKIENTATLVENGKTEKTSTVRVNVLKPDLKVTKTVNASEIVAGDIFDYSIKIENTGQGKALNVNLVDIISSDLEIISFNGASNSNKTIYAIYSTLDKNEVKDITIKVKAKSSISVGVLENEATVVSDNDTTKKSTATVKVIKPVIKVIKEASLENVKRNTNFKYTIKVSNNGTGTASNVKVTDKIDKSFEIVSVSDGTFSNNTVTKVYDKLLEGETKYIEVTVKVKESSNLGSINNTVEVTSDNAGESEDSVSVNIVDSDIKITKNYSGSKIKMIGESFKYVINIVNAGDSSSGSLSFSDYLPEGLEYKSSNAYEDDSSLGLNFLDINYSNGTITLNKDSLGKGKTITIEIYVTISNNVSDNAIISNTAKLKENGKKEISSTTSIKVVKPNVSIKKTSNLQEVKRGNTFKYTINIKNESEITLKNIQVSDIIDSNFTVKSLNGTEHNSNTINITYDNLESKEEKTIEIEVYVKKDATLGNINSTAKVSTGDYENSSSTDIKVVDSNLVLKKEIHNILNNDTFTSNTNDYIKTINEEFTYYIMATNTGDIKSDKVVIEDTIPNNFEVISVTSRYKNNLISYSLNNNILTINLDSIEVNSFVNIMIKVKVKNDSSTGEVINSVSLKENGSNEINSSVNVTIVKPTLNITKKVSSNTIKKGDTFKYEININNIGDGSSLNTSFIDVINSDLEIISVKGANIKNNIVFIDYSEILPSENKTIEITVKAKESITSNEINNTAKVIYNGIEKDASVKVSIVDSKLEVNKEVSKSALKINEEFIYTIKINNTGDAISNKVNVYDKIDSNLEVIDAYILKNNTKNNINISNNILNIDLDPININETVNIVIKAKVKENTELGLNINNEVTLKEKDKSDIKDSVSIVITDSDIYMTKTVSKDKYQVDDTVTYTIKVYNSGNDDAENILIKDTLDNRLTFINTNLNDTEYTFNESTFTYNISSLKSGEDIEIIINCRLNKLASNNDSVDNIATLSYNNKEQTSSSNFKVIAPLLTVSKISSIEKAKDKEEFYYVITVKNIGEGIAKNILVKDYLPSEINVLASDGNLDDNTLSWTIDKLESNKEVSFIIKVSINSDSDNKNIRNKVIVTSNDEDIEDSVDILIYKDKIDSSEKIEENPNTGSFINYIVSIVFLIISLVIISMTKKKQLFIK